MKNFKASIEDSKKSIQKKLRIKSFLGFFYLALSIIFFFPSFSNSNFFPEMREFFGLEQNEDSGGFFFLFGCLYLVHWFYASIFFPAKYFSIFKKGKYQFCGDYDASNVRALFTNALVTLIFFWELYKRKISNGHL